jgi:hypothetical protein
MSESIYRQREDGTWERVRTAYDGCQDGSLEMEMHRLQMRDPNRRYRTFTRAEIERGQNIEVQA